MRLPTCFWWIRKRARVTWNGTGHTQSYENLLSQYLEYVSDPCDLIDMNDSTHHRVYAYGA